MNTYLLQRSQTDTTEHSIILRFFLLAGDTTGYQFIIWNFCKLGRSSRRGTALWYTAVTLLKDMHKVDQFFIWKNEAKDSQLSKLETSTKKTQDYPPVFLPLGDSLLETNGKPLNGESLIQQLVVKCSEGRMKGVIGLWSTSICILDLVVPVSSSDESIIIRPVAVSNLSTFNWSRSGKFSTLLDDPDKDKQKIIISQL